MIAVKTLYAHCVRAGARRGNVVWTLKGRCKGVVRRPHSVLTSV